MAHKDSVFLSQALDLAKTASSLDEVPVGAVVVRSGQVVGRGFNVREIKQDPTGHAEIVAIREASKNLGTWRLEDCEIYVTLEPCLMCLGAIQQSRFKKVFYGASDSKGGALSLGYEIHKDVRTNHRFEIENLSSQECGEVLSNFFKTKRIKK